MVLKAPTFDSQTQYLTDLNNFIPQKVSETSGFVSMKFCSLPECGRKRHAGTYCKRHYRRWKSTGDPNKLKRRANGQGSVHRGYIITKIGDRRTGEHVHAMEAHLKRRLLPGESVHHKNGIKTDNRLSNLELWVIAQPYGQRAIDIRYCVHCGRGDSLESKITSTIYPTYMGGTQTLPNLDSYTVN